VAFDSVRQSVCMNTGVEPAKDSYFAASALKQSRCRCDAEMKKSCQRHCFSTLNHNLACCYDDSRVIKFAGHKSSRIAGKTEQAVVDE
jgi:hypothetical protein